MLYSVLLGQSVPLLEKKKYHKIDMKTRLLIGFNVTTFFNFIHFSMSFAPNIYSDLEIFTLNRDYTSFV